MLPEADVGTDLEDLAGDVVGLFHTAANTEEGVEIRLPEPVHQPQSFLYVLRDTPLRLPVPSNLSGFDLEAQGQVIDNDNVQGRE